MHKRDRTEDAVLSVIQHRGQRRNATLCFLSAIDEFSKRDTALRGEAVFEAFAGCQAVRGEVTLLSVLSPGNPYLDPPPGVYRALGGKPMLQDFRAMGS